MKADRIQIELYLGDPMSDVRVTCWLTDLTPKPQPDELPWPALWEARPEIGPLAEHARKDPQGYLVTAGGACTESLRRSVTGFDPHYLRGPRSVLPLFASTELMGIMPCPKHGMGRGILRWKSLRTDMGKDRDKLPESIRNRRACRVDLRVARPRACPAVSLRADPVPSATTRIVGMFSPCASSVTFSEAADTNLDARPSHTSPTPRYQPFAEIGAPQEASRAKPTTRRAGAFRLVSGSTALSARLEIIVGRATALLESASRRRPHHV